MEHDQSTYFCRVPDDFCWGFAPVGATLVTGPQWDLKNERPPKAEESLKLKLRLHQQQRRNIIVKATVNHVERCFDTVLPWLKI